MSGDRKKATSEKSKEYKESRILRIEIKTENVQRYEESHFRNL